MNELIKKYIDNRTKLDRQIVIRCVEHRACSLSEIHCISLSSGRSPCNFFAVVALSPHVSAAGRYSNESILTITLWWCRGRQAFKLDVSMLLPSTLVPCFSEEKQHTSFQRVFPCREAEQAHCSRVKGSVIWDDPIEDPWLLCIARGRSRSFGSLWRTPPGHLSLMVRQPFPT